MIISIAPATEEHAQDYIRILKSPVTTNQLASVFRSTPYTKIFHHFMITKKDSLIFSIFRNTKVVGFVNLIQIDWPNKTGNLGYVIHSKYRHQGIAAQAVSKFLDHLFFVLGIHSVYAHVVASNRSSIRVLEKNGFRYIGSLKDAHKSSYGYEDKMIFNLVKES